MRNDDHRPDHGANADRAQTTQTTLLAQKLARLIATTEPISIAQFMHIAMNDPQLGYYQKQRPIGRAGDFITAPEVSQMFGEIIAVWLMSIYQQLGSPQKFNLVEAGPGKGTLMADILRAAKARPDFLNAAEIHLVETSHSMRKAQKQALAVSGKQPVWHNTIDTLPKQPTLFVANEFLDVIPFRQFVKHQGKWFEQMVGLDDVKNLCFTLGPASLDPAILPAGHEGEGDGAVFEYAPAREAVTEEIAHMIAQNTGAALLIDYGHAKSGFGDTFQAVRQHKSVHVLDHIGECDLTSHVDFEALARTVKSMPEADRIELFKLVTQSEFLLGHGLLERAGQLGSDKDEETRKRLTREAERLALPHEMGDLFKCFSFASR